MTANQLSTDVAEVKVVADQILSTVELLDPVADVPANEASTILTLVTSLVTAALTAWGNASGQTIDATTIAALMPNSTPLSEPTA